jgi:hypothetical protein
LLPANAVPGLFNEGIIGGYKEPFHLSVGIFKFDKEGC